jgi:hypothetical protein
MSPATATANPCPATANAAAVTLSAVRLPAAKGSSR